MKIESVRLENFLSHGTGAPMIDLTASPLWLFIGPNGAGKTSVFEAVEFALYGRHRLGTRQYANRLVRQGADRAQIEVVLTHAGQRYRATRQISRRAGNEGGSLFREEAGCWEPVREVGDGKQAVWDYVEAHLMPYEHFCSGVYLHQDGLGHFLSHGPDQRAKRFARLMDLEELDGLAERAHKLSQEETARVAVLQEMIDRCGDVSPEALQRACEELRDAEVASEDAQRASEASVTLERDASDWNEGQRQLERLDGEIGGQRALLEEAKAIRDADATVRIWDAAAPQLERVWSRLEEAAGHRERADEAQRVAHSADLEAAELREQCEGLRSRLAELQDPRLPQLQQRVRTAEAECQAIDLEYRIAEQLKRGQKAQEILDQLGDVPAELRAWEESHRALPQLQELAEARASVKRLERALVRRRNQARAARAEREAAAKELRQADWQVETLGQACRRADAAVVEWKRQIEALAGEIRKHRQLSRDARRCPVCDQDLNRPAREHVRRVIREKQATLRTLKASARKAEAQRTKDVAARDRATAALGRAQARSQRHERRVADANTDVRELEAQRSSERQRVGRALEAAQREGGAFSDQLAGLTLPRVKALGNRLDSKAAGLKAAAQKHTQARRTHDDASSQAQALRGQRNVEPPAGIADAIGQAEIARLRTRALGGLTEAQAALREAETDQSSLLEDLNRILPLQATRATLAAQKRLQAGEHLTRAEAAERVAAETKVPEPWTACARSREAYEQQKTAVGQLRPLAERLQPLGQAEATLIGLNRQRQQLLERLEIISEAHRVRPEEARQQRADAGARLQLAQRSRDDALQVKAQLEANQTQARQLQQDLLRADHHCKVYTDLARLLGPGGPVQQRVIQTVQEEICRLANAILRRAGDSLEIQLGDPLRAGSIEKDVVFVDREEPSAGDRLYEQLSAGEKTRVAMAIAAVIHGRASGGEVGTLIIDEAFAALDDAHRRAYAMEVADVSAGWLEQGLVGQVIVTTHVSDVHGYFTACYRIDKADGQAQVICSLG